MTQTRLILIFCQYPENPIQLSNRLDVQGVGAGEVFKIVLEQGAGSQAGTAGDSIMHCHLYPHFAGGIWSAIRVFDKLRINFTDPNDINSNLPDGTPLLYPDRTQEAVLVPLPAKMAIFDTRVLGAVDKRAPAPRGMPNRTAMIPDKDHPGYPNFVAPERRTVQGVCATLCERSQPEKGQFPDYR